MFVKNEFMNPDKMYAPLQIVHDFDFMHWNSKDEFESICGIDNDAKLVIIEKRLKDLKDKGFGGVIVNVGFENYLNDESAWDVFVKAIDIAISLELRIWIYDEQYYPTGSAGGNALNGHPEYEAIALDCVTCVADGGRFSPPVRVHSPYGHSSLQYAFAVKMEDDKLDFANQINISSFATSGGGLCWEAPEGKWKIFSFFTRSHFEGAYVISAMRAPRRSIDFCNKEAVKHFLDVTYGKYKDHLGKRINKIESIFFDEPGLMSYCDYPEEHVFGPRVPSKIDFYEPYDEKVEIFPFIHWSNGMAEKFEQMKGYSLIENLPALFEGGDEYRFLRIDYSEYIEKQFITNFIEQYKKYLEKYNIQVGGHYRCTERMGTHPRLYGDILKCLGNMDNPGCDRLKASNVERNMISEKVVSSAAHMYGNKKTLVEASNMQLEFDPLTFDRLLCSVAIDYVQGIDIITSYYDETIFTPDEYRIFNVYASRLAYLFKDGIHCTQAAVYYPFKQTADEVAIMNQEGEIPHVNDGASVYSYYMDSLHNLSINLMNNMIDFDYINDECLLNAEIKDGVLTPPNGEKNRMLLLPDVNFVTEDVANVIKTALSRGIYVGVYGEKHKIDGLENVNGIEFFDNNTLPAPLDFITDKPYPNLRFLHKEFYDYDLYLVVQTEDKPITTACNIPAKYSKVSKIDLIDGTVDELEVKATDDRLEFELSLKPLEAKVYLIHNGKNSLCTEECE